MPPTTLFHLSPGSVNFDEASARVVEYLQTVIPMGFWAVTRFDGERQVYLEVRDSAYGLAAGGSHRWEDSFCINMVAGRTPQIAPDAKAIPEYAAAGVSEQISIGAYIGMPTIEQTGPSLGPSAASTPQRWH